MNSPVEFNDPRMAGMMGAPTMPMPMGGIPAYVGRQALATTGMDQLSLGGGMPQEGFSLTRALKKGVEGVTDMVKGLFTPTGLLMAAGSMALVGLFGAAVLPYMLGIGVALSGWQLGSGILGFAGNYMSGNHRAAEDAFKDIFGGTLGMGLSIWGIKGHYKGLGAQGVKVELTTATESVSSALTPKQGGLFGFFGGGRSAGNAVKAVRTAEDVAKAGWKDSVGFFVKDLMGKTKYTTKSGQSFSSVHGWAQSEISSNWAAAKEIGVWTKIKDGLFASKDTLKNNKELMDKAKNDRFLAFAREEMTKHNNGLRTSRAKFDNVHEFIKHKGWGTVETKMVGGRQVHTLKSINSQGWSATAARIKEVEAHSLLQALFEHNQQMVGKGIKVNGFTDKTTLEQFALRMGFEKRNGQLVLGKGGAEKLAQGMNQVAWDSELMSLARALSAGDEFAILQYQKIKLSDYNGLKGILERRLGNGDEKAGRTILEKLISQSGKKGQEITLVDGTKIRAQRAQGEIFLKDIFSAMEGNMLTDIERQLLARTIFGGSKTTAGAYRFNDFGGVADKARWGALQESMASLLPGELASFDAASLKLTTNFPKLTGSSSWELPGAAAGKGGLFPNVHPEFQETYASVSQAVSGSNAEQVLAANVTDNLSLWQRFWYSDSMRQQGGPLAILGIVRGNGYMNAPPDMDRFMRRY